jgi:hypothetical protein
MPLTLLLRTVDVAQRPAAAVVATLVATIHLAWFLLASVEQMDLAAFYGATAWTVGGGWRSSRR